MKKRILSILMLTMLTVASIAGCSPSTTAEEQETGDASAYKAIAKEDIKIGEINPIISMMEVGVRQFIQVL